MKLENRIYIFIALVALFIPVGCSSLATPTYYNVTNIKFQENEKRNSSNVKTKENYLGCWSAGDKGGTVLYITSETIQTSNSYKPLKYSEILLDSGKLVFLLRLDETDESNEIQPFISITLLQNDEIKLEDFDSYEDFLNKGSHGETKFYKSLCKNVLPRLKSKKTP